MYILKNTPTTPDTELTVYSLKDNDFIKQAAVLFQKKYPDVYVNIETGMSGDDSVTDTDALKVLKYRDHGRKRSGCSCNGWYSFRYLCGKRNAEGYQLHS